MSEQYREIYIKSLAGALSPDKNVRKEAELNLEQLEKVDDFLLALLNIISSQDLDKGVRVNAAIYFKNKITRVWLNIATVDSWKMALRQQLCKVIFDVHGDSHLQKQLTEALYKILVIDDWPELCDSALKFLNSNSFGEVFTGLLLIFQLFKSKRWNRSSEIENYVFKVLPTLAHLAQNFVKQFDSQDQASDELLYLILKIIKYSTYVELPTYFMDSNNLSTWVQLQLHIISAPIPQYILDLDEDERKRIFRVKSIKWSYANIRRLQSKHGGGSDSKLRETEFAKFFNTQFVPVILDLYWKEISLWSSSQKWLSDSSLYYMISFLEGCCSVDEAWALVYEQFDAVLKHLVFRSLCATEASLELFEDDSEEYYRRYLDTNKDVNTADVAAINFIFGLCFKRFPQVVDQLLSLLNETFSNRSSNLNNIDLAKATEGGLRILSSISFKIVKKTSPVAHQIDQMISSFIVPELGEQNKFKFLKARACDVIASFAYTYQDMQVLSSVYEGCMNCFQDNECLPLQITSADALGTLITEAEVERAIVPHVTSIMEKLLSLSNSHEFDVINSIMDDFVEKFALQLEPFSTQIAANLKDQLIKIGGELLENGGDGSGSAEDVDKEYQASGILNTMMTMILSMNSSKEITLHLLNEILPAIKFILENAMVNFIHEVMELLESCNVTLKVISPLMWEFFQLTLDSFDTYGEEFHEVYVPFWESCINYGFKDKTKDDPHFLLLMKVTIDSISNADPYDAYSSLEPSFEIVYKTILTISDLEPMIPQLLTLCSSTYYKLDQDVQAGVLKSFLKVLLSSSYRFPMVTLKVYHEEEILQLFNLWFQSESLLSTLFDLKLQVLVVINIFKLKYQGIEMPSCIEQGESTLKSKLIHSLQNLPSVVSKQHKMLMDQSGHKKDIDDYENGEDYFNDQQEEFEYEVEEVDLFKDILFDHLNVYDEFVNGFLKNGDNYNRFMQGINDNTMINVVNECINVMK